MNEQFLMPRLHSAASPATRAAGNIAAAASTRVSVVYTQPSYFFTGLLATMADVEVVAATAVCLLSVMNYLNVLKRNLKKRRYRQRRWWMKKIHQNRTT